MEAVIRGSIDRGVESLVASGVYNLSACNDVEAMIATRFLVGICAAHYASRNRSNRHHWRTNDENVPCFIDSARSPDPRRYHGSVGPGSGCAPPHRHGTEPLDRRAHVDGGARPSPRW